MPPTIFFCLDFFFCCFVLLVVYSVCECVRDWEKYALKFEIFLFIYLIYINFKHVTRFYLTRLCCNLMTFVYFLCEFYRISNVVAYETLILDYNGEFNLGICLFFFFFLFKFTYSSYNFSNLILYIFNF